MNDVKAGMRFRLRQGHNDLTWTAIRPMHGGDWIARCDQDGREQKGSLAERWWEPIADVAQAVKPKETMPFLAAATLDEYGYFKACCVCGGDLSDRVMACEGCWNGLSIDDQDRANAARLNLMSHTRKARAPMRAVAECALKERAMVGPGSLQHLTDAERAVKAMREAAAEASRVVERGPSAVALAKAREPWVDSLPIDWWLPDAR